MTDSIHEPSVLHATCAWCGQAFASIVELLDHVAAGHLDGTVTRSPRSTTTNGLAA